MFYPSQRAKKTLSTIKHTHKKQTHNHYTRTPTPHHPSCSIRHNKQSKLNNHTPNKKNTNHHTHTQVLHHLPRFTHHNRQPNNKHAHPPTQKPLTTHTSTTRPIMFHPSQQTINNQTQSRTQQKQKSTTTTSAHKHHITHHVLFIATSNKQQKQTCAHTEQ